MSLDAESFGQARRLSGIDEIAEVQRGLRPALDEPPRVTSRARTIWLQCRTWCDTLATIMTMQRPGALERKAIANYLYKRLSRECQDPGALARIAEDTGIAPATLHRILRERGAAGSSVARPLAAYWKMTFAELQRVVIGIPLCPEEDSLPNLSATLTWGRDVYPVDFLVAYGLVARKAPTDRTRQEWLADMDDQLRSWAGGGKIVLRIPEPIQQPTINSSGVRPRLGVTMKPRSQ